MNVYATVRYNSDHERTSINVNAKQAVGVTARFNLEGSTAILTSVENEGFDDSQTVYADNLSYVMDYVEGLPFVQAVTIDEYEPPEESHE